MKHFTLISAVLLLFSSTYGQSYTFKNGVSLSHWAGNMIEEYSYADTAWFNKEDVEWIAQTGIDHIQLYIAGTEIIDADGTIITEKMAAIDSLVAWCRQFKLGVVLAPGRMPPAKVDSTLTIEQQTEQRLSTLVKNTCVFAGHFNDRSDQIRLMINVGGDNQALRNKYFRMVVPELRKINSALPLLLMAYSINHLADLYIPANDRNIIIAAEISQSSEAKSEPIDVFCWQYQEYYFKRGMSAVSFPGTIPAIDTFATDLAKWSLKFAGAKLQEDYFDNKLGAIERWRTKNHPGLELYIAHWRYWTGYPFDPVSIKDEKSVRTFISSFVNAAKKHKINWCFYDYNSGSAIRYANGEPSFLLKEMKLKQRF